MSGSASAASPAHVPLLQQPNLVADVAEQALPSVVNISSTKKVSQTPFRMDPFFEQFFGPGFRFEGPGPRAEQSLGSGVIVRADGIVLTNHHVIKDAEKVRVTLSDKREYDAKVIGSDPPSDLAVLRLQNPPKDLKAISFGDSDALRLGDLVVAIGNPFGVGQTVTLGIVSAKGRSNMGIVDYEDFIQTDAAINPGNSGGALMSLRGELVGINTAILSRSGGNQGIGFAIPANMARNIMTSLIDHGKVTRGFLGVMIQDLTEDLRAALKIDARDGVLVSDVTEDSPAAKAGIKAQDVIVEVDGKKVESSSRLRNLIAASGDGRKVKLKVIRDGDEKTFEVTLGKKESTEAPAPGEAESSRLGVRVQPLNKELRERFDVPARVENGVLVLGVQPGSAAANAGLREGDVILEADRRTVKSAADLTKAWSGKNQLLLRVHRQGSTIFLVVKK